MSFEHHFPNRHLSDYFLYIIINSINHVYLVRFFVLLLFFIYLKWSSFVPCEFIMSAMLGRFGHMGIVARYATLGQSCWQWPSKGFLGRWTLLIYFPSIWAWLVCSALEKGIAQHPNKRVRPKNINTEEIRKL